MNGPAVFEKARLYPLLNLVVSVWSRCGLKALLHSPEEPLEADHGNRHYGQPYQSKGGFTASESRVEEADRQSC